MTSTTEPGRVDAWDMMYAGLAVALLVFAVAHRCGVL